MLKLSWHRFQLLDPYLYRGESRSSKESCFLALDFQNQTFYSELSVFPGLHETNKKVYESQLPQNLFEGLVIPQAPFHDLKELLSWAHQFYSNQLPPNTLQALDTLLLEILGHFQKLPQKWQSLYQQKSWCCHCAQFITQLDHGLHLRELEGTYKIKAGRADLEQEIKWLKQWIKQNPRARVRLDANEMWSTQQLEALLGQLSSRELSSIEYLEDPCPPKSWAELSLAKKPDLALENLQGHSIQPEVRVYRPASEQGFLLGLAELEQNLKESANLNIVLSTSFETELGLRWLILAANILGLKKGQGLGTLPHLRPENPLSTQLFNSRQEGENLCISRL